MSTLIGTSLATVIDTMVNSLLRQDPHILARLNAVASGKSVTVARTSPDGTVSQQLTLIITPSRLHVHSVCESADATLSGSSRALLALVFSDDPAAALHHPDITLAGDVHLIQQLHREITRADSGLEDLLAAMVRPFADDTVFALGASAVRTGADAVRQGVRELRLSAGDFLQEESGLLPTKPEIRQTHERLDRLRLRLDRLQARLQQLQQHVTN
jgi:ubiquinone biosynthesis accessory factor UbiJ